MEQDKISQATFISGCESGLEVSGHKLESGKNFFIGSELKQLCPNEWDLGNGSFPLWRDSNGTLGFRVGRGTKVDLILLCAHYHLRGVITGRTLLSMHLEPVSENPHTHTAQLGPGGYAFSQDESGKELASKIANSSFTFTEEAIIHLFGIHVHLHSSAMIGDRMIIELMRQNGSKTVLIDAKTHGIINTYFHLSNDALRIHPNDSIVNKCIFQPDPMGQSSHAVTDQ